MTAANNGTSTPEDDDPFGYLYEDGQAAGATPPRSGGYGYPGPASPSQPGVPRTSYNQVRTVGERQYGQPQQQYAQQVPPQQQYHQPNAHYAAPETRPGGAPTRQVPVTGGGGGGRSGGPNTKGLLIGAVAVVAVVVIGIGVALMTSGKDDDKGTQAGGTGGGGSSAGQTVKPSDDPTDKPQEPGEPLPKQDAATLQLGGTATTDKTIEGAEGPGGTYISGFNAVGSSITWQANIDKAGPYRFYMRYSIPAKDANATLTVNGKPNTQPVGLKNFIKSSDPDLAKNWQTTWAPVALTEGQNTIKLSCEEGNQCDALLDWVEIRTTAP